MAEGGMPKIVTHAYSPGQVSVQMQSLADSHRYGGHMHNMLHPGADMVVVGSEENLGLMLKPPVWIRMDYGSKIPEKASPDIFYPGIQTIF